jgi:hypothetical protein
MEHEMDDCLATGTPYSPIIISSPGEQNCLPIQLTLSLVGFKGDVIVPKCLMLNCFSIPPSDLETDHHASEFLIHADSLESRDELSSCLNRYQSPGGHMTIDG